MLRKIRDFQRWARPYRKKFGWLPGEILALDLRSDYRLAPGTIFRARVPRLIHPVYLRAGTSDAQVLYQIVVNEELGFTIDPAPRFIIDAGANIGLSAIYLANRFPDAKIVALEVERTNFEILVRNTSPYPNIVPRHQGLWGRRGTLAIQNPAAEHYAFTVDEAEASVDTESEVEAVTVTDILREFERELIDLLKLDVEGSEIEIFTISGTDWIDRASIIAVELHDRFREGCTKALEDLIADRPFSRSVRGEYLILQRSTRLTPDRDGARWPDLELT